MSAGDSIKKCKWRLEDVIFVADRLPGDDSLEKVDRRRATISIRLHIRSCGKQLRVQTLMESARMKSKRPTSALAHAYETFKLGRQRLGRS